MIRSTALRSGRPAVIRSPLLAVLGCVALAASPARAEALKPEPTPYTVAPGFDGETKDGRIRPAFDLSGAACRPAGPDGARTCVAVNDENSGAQIFRLSGATITPGATAFDQGRAPAPGIRGIAPETFACTGGSGAFDQLDGEAVAYAEPYFYVTGSHGCTRGKRRYTLSAMILTRLRVDAAGTVSERLSTYRLTDALKASEAVRDDVLRDLEFDWHNPPPAGTPQPNGLNIEGLAVVGDRLYAGLRAPTLDGTAHLVSVPVAALFADGDAPLQSETLTIPLKLGQDAGIRDLAALDDGRLLVLAGPARNRLDVPYTLSIAELPSGRLTPLGTLEPVRGPDADGKTITGKPEAVVRLGPGRVLVLFDSLRDGAPHAYAVPVP